MNSGGGVEAKKQKKGCKVKRENYNHLLPAGVFPSDILQRAKLFI